MDKIAVPLICLMIGLAIGMLIGSLITIYDFHDKLIQKGYAEYNKTTGVFQYKQTELKWIKQKE